MSSPAGSGAVSLLAHICTPHSHATRARARARTHTHQYMHAQTHHSQCPHTAHHVDIVHTPEKRLFTTRTSSGGWSSPDTVRIKVARLGKVFVFDRLCPRKASVGTFAAHLCARTGVSTHGPVLFSCMYLLSCTHKPLENDLQIANLIPLPHPLVEEELERDLQKPRM